MKDTIKKEKITFRRKDEWLHECVTKIVETKRDAGMKTSFSYELVRLARNGMLNEMRGAEKDQEILKGGDDDSTD